MNTSEIKLTADQQDIVDDLTAWLEQWRDNPDEVRSGKPYKTVGGYAGTGKTVTIAEFMKKLGDELQVLPFCVPAVATYTGKAASVLRKKGVQNAKTIHSTIYKLIPQTQPPKFERIAPEAFPHDLLVIDEASMVPTEIHEDLLSYGIPIIYVGDHGQLEPIGDNAKLMIDPDLKLEEILRQHDDSLIPWFAEHLRHNKAIRPQAEHDIHVARNADFFKLLKEHWDPDAEPFQFMAICGFNKQRQAINTFIRKNILRLGSGGQPDVLHDGETVMCLANNKELGIFNGMQATILSVNTVTATSVIADIQTDGGRIISDVWMNRKQFGREKTLPFTTVNHRSGETLFDYGYAGTCHKCQGSEWPTTFVYEELWPQKWTSSRWRYTAATRASEMLYYCMR